MSDSPEARIIELERRLAAAQIDLMRHLRVAEATADYVDNHHQRSDDPDFQALSEVVEEWRLMQEKLLAIKRGKKS